MANTYTQLNIHAIFSVQGRENILNSKVRTELFSYSSGILNNLKQFPLAVNGYKDHIHIFFELNPITALSDIIRTLKSSSSKWINENHFLPGRFSWQEGYGAFSYSRSQRDKVINYIMKQEEHHQKKPFKTEYLELLKNFNIDFNNKYVFEFH